MDGAVGLYRDLHRMKRILHVYLAFGALADEIVPGLRAQYDTLDGNGDRAPSSGKVSSCLCLASQELCDGSEVS